jgi:hypothetical protein
MHALHEEYGRRLRWLARQSSLSEMHVSPAYRTVVEIGLDAFPRNTS